MPNKVKISDSELKRYTQNGSSSKTIEFIVKQKIGKVELISEQFKWIIDFDNGKFIKFSGNKLESSFDEHVGELITDLIDLIKTHNFESVVLFRRKDEIKNIKSVKNFKMESKLSNLKNAAAAWYDSASDTSGWDPKFDKLTLDLFKTKDIPPDVSAYYDVIKHRPNAKDLFVKYITHHRPSGHFYMGKEPTNRQLPMTRRKLENYIRKIVKEIMEK